MAFSKTVLFLFLFCGFFSPTSSLLPRNTDRTKVQVQVQFQFQVHAPLVKEAKYRLPPIFATAARHSRDVEGGDSSPSPSSLSSNRKYLVTGLPSVASWCIIAYVALSRHPTPAIDAACGLRHNGMTIAQALAFPLPLLVAVFSTLKVSDSTTPTARRLNLGLAVASLWTAASVMFGPTFSVGYDLFSKNPAVRYGCTAVHGTTAVVALAAWRRAGGGSISRLVRGCVGSIFALFSPKSSEGGAALEDDDDDDDGENDSALYSLASLGLLVLAVLPQLVGFPTATIPTLLGKRLSRAGSGFTFLGAVGAYCLKDASERGDLHKEPAVILRRGLGIGAAAHLGLVVAKVVGVDGGGLILPGRGLWKDYPSLVAASGAATTLMCVTYAVLAFAALGKTKSE
jgi:hypothetical protein